MECRLVGSDAVTVAGVVQVVLKYDGIPAGIRAAHVVEDFMVQRRAGMHGAVVPRRIQHPEFRIVDDSSAGKLFSWTACAVLPRLGNRR
jgi:hypothetical protein